MRTKLALCLWFLSLGACGGTGDGPPAAGPAPETLFSGDYFTYTIEGDTRSGPWGEAGWGEVTADGSETYSITLATCDPLGGLLPWPALDLPYEVDADRTVIWRRGGDFEWRGGISAGGAVLGMGAYGAGHDPTVAILVQRGLDSGPGELLGTYHYAAYGYVLPAVSSESRWGSAAFDGIVDASVTWKANTDGAVTPDWAVESLDYAVSHHGQVTLDVPSGLLLTGAVLAGGELAVLSGGTLEGMPPCLWVLVASSTGATEALLDGTYFAVGIELDHSTQVATCRAYSGTVRADGAGGLEPDLRMKDPDAVSGYAPIWTGYSVDDDGALEVTTAMGEHWIGGVSPSGRFAVFAGDIDGGDPVLFFLFR